MKQVCVQAVSRALGRPVDRVEAQAIEARLLKALREDARDRATWSQRDFPERVRAAAERIAGELTGAAVRARAALSAPPAGKGRRFAQSSPAREFSAAALRFGTEAELAELRTLADAGGSLDAIFGHPVMVRVQEHYQSSAPTMRPEDATSAEFFSQRQYVRQDGSTTDLAGALDELRAHFEAQAGGPVARDRHAVIVLGHTGSGKSTAIDALARGLRAAFVDADKAKEVIPEYQGGFNAEGVHAESAELRAMVQTDLAADGANMIIERVGDKEPSLRRVIAELRSRSYSVELVLVDVSADEAARRSARRFVMTGRSVAPSMARDHAGKPRPVFDRLIEEGLADGYIRIDAEGKPEEAVIAAAGGSGSSLAELVAAGVKRRRGQFVRQPGNPGGNAPSGRAPEGGESLKQSAAGELRGETEIPAGGAFADPGVVVRLFSSADRSTAPHEFGHVFLETMTAYEARADAPDALKGDMAIVRRWLGSEGGDFTTAQHEQFADGFLAYLREGQAPQPALQRVFDAFADWLVAIYRSVRELLGDDVHLSDDMRAVFARLVGEPDAERAGRDRHADGARGGLHIRYERAGAVHPDVLQPNARPGAGGAGDRGTDNRAGGRADDAAVAGDDAGAGRRGGAPDASPASRIPPRLLARDPDLKAIADDLGDARAELDALERQGVIAPEEAAAARADLEAIEKTSARPELFRAAAFCLQYGARVNPGVN